ncbi:hypothetical protein CC80DRAFT_549151 [Byssothecium circinans]|uniref:BTB domain-containing protein n=1 Tax=Byssothecium circinans TaxID=147558 RepID=A0A6A5TUN5_9PLEO|nr:hypothetical protein CC80DRAFT_549151 [Byssothecium circinans]
MLQPNRRLSIASSSGSDWSYTEDFPTADDGEKNGPAEKFRTLPPSQVLLGANELSDVVTVTLGTCHKNFKIHRDSLRYYSGYFRNVFEDKHEDKDEDEDDDDDDDDYEDEDEDEDEEADAVLLDDVEPGVFTLFVNWIYHEQLPHGTQWLQIGGEPQPEPSRLDVAINLLRLKASALADRIDAPAYKKAVHNDFVEADGERERYTPSYEYIIYAFNHFKPDDIVLDYLVGKHVAQWTDKSDSDDDKKLLTQVSYEFLMRVNVKNGQRKGDPSSVPNSGNQMVICNYHIHDSNAERDACMFNDECIEKDTL